MKLRKMKIGQLREMAASLGADKNKLYGTSKDSIILTITHLMLTVKCKEVESNG